MERADPCDHEALGERSWYLPRRLRWLLRIKLEGPRRTLAPELRWVMAMQETRDRSGWEARTAREEVARLLGRIRALTKQLRSLRQRGGPDVDMKERELELLRWRLAAAARRTVSSDAGAAA